MIHKVKSGPVCCQKSGNNCGNVDGGGVRSGSGGKQAVNGIRILLHTTPPLLTSHSSGNLIPDKILYSGGKFGGSNLREQMASWMELLRGMEPPGLEQPAPSAKNPVTFARI